MKQQQKQIIGWREWVTLPKLGIQDIKAKIDTGARTSSLHADNIRHIMRGNRPMVKFIVHPLQRNSRITREAVAGLVDERIIRSSSGHEEKRPVIETFIELLGWQWPIEITLTSRDVMGFRMLLGRQAIRDDFIIDAGRSFVGGRPQKGKVRQK